MVALVTIFIEEKKSQKIYNFMRNIFNLKFINKCSLFFIRFVKKHYPIIFICFLALFLRVFGANFGLPDLFVHSDENGHVKAVWAFIDKSSSPYKEGLPLSGFYYVLAAFLYLYKIAVKEFFTAEFFLAARVFSGILSTITVFVTYKIGERLFNKKVGLLAAIFLSLTFIDVLVAHYIKEDVYIQLYGVLAIYFFVRAVDKDKITDHLLSIVFIALAILTKLNGLAIAIPYLLWISLGNIKAKKETSLKEFFKINKKRYLLGILCLILIIGAFLMSPRLPFTPVDESTGKIIVQESLISKLDYNKVLEPEGPNQIFTSGLNGIKNYLWWPYYLMMSGYYYPLFFLLILGLVFFAFPRFRQKMHPGLKYIVIAVVAYYLLLSIQNNRFDRWITVITPFIAIFSAYGISCFLKKIENIKFYRTPFIVLVIFILGFSFLRIVLFDFLISQKETNKKAYDWITGNYSKEDLLLISKDLLLNPVLFNLNYRVNSFELGHPYFFKFAGETLILSSQFYQPIVNYRGYDPIKKQFENYQLVEKNSPIIKKFSSAFFDSGFFSPKFLETGSQVNYFHNPTIEIYKIPEIAELAKDDFEYGYNLSEMIKADPALKNNKISDELYFYKKDKSAQSLIIGPNLLLPKGKYILAYSLKTNNNKSLSEIVRINIAVSGVGTVLKYQPIKGIYFKQVNSYQDFAVEFDNPTTQRLDFKLSSASPTELWVKGAFLKESHLIISETPSSQPDLENNLIQKFEKWDIATSEDKKSTDSFKKQRNITTNSQEAIKLSTKEEKLQVSLSYKDKWRGYGFSDSKYAGQPFAISAWIKASKSKCVKIGFYRGNISSFGWSDYNDYGNKDKYELIAYKDYFDNPYTLNGNVYFRIESNCEVEIANIIVALDK